MDPRTTERVERWDSRPFRDGYDGLSDLADKEFSGAVTAAGTWLFMLNGRVVGIVDGTIEDFDDATGTTYEAPDPALPLLCSMEETGGETRAKYYTNETPLEDVDGTLSSGSFTGYVELSEGVLSGDYYAVYYGGRRMAAAYIGNAERLLTGEEAFERAADEVGIYEVVDVDVDVTDVPGSEASAPAETGAANDDGAVDSTPDAASETAAEVDSEPSPASSASSSSPSPTPVTDAETETGPETAGTDPTDSARSTSASPVDGAVDSRSDDLESTSEPESSTDTALDDMPGGITTSDEEPIDPASPGITDDLSGSLIDEATDASESATEAVTEPESRSEPETATNHDERATTSSRTDDEGAEEMGVESEAEAEVESKSETEGETGPESEPEPEPDTDRSQSAPPDPDDLETAAEELGESGVPWSEAEATGSVAVDADTGTEAEADTNTNIDADSAVATADEIDLTATADESAAELEERFKQEEQWRETRSIPSIDPDNTAKSAAPQKKGRQTQRRSRSRSTPAANTSRTQESSERRQQSGSRAGSSSSSTSTTGTGTGTETGQPDRSTQTQPSQQSSGRTSETEQSPHEGAAKRSSQSQDPGRGQNQGQRPGAGSKSPEDALESDMLEREDKIDRLTQKVDDLEQHRDELKTKLSDLEHERDRLESENEKLTETVERLEGRIEELESELERARSAEATGASNAAATGSRGTELTPQQALEGTNLFVRYSSKSQPTLETAHDGEADATAVGSNLLLEHHTQFDETDVTVDGVPYEEYLTSTMEYQFVDWLTGTLLYEIRDTDHATALGDLYDVIPRIDRAELHASISLEEDDTEEVPDQVTFDVVAFDKRGTPLVAANLNDSRDPATREMLIELEETASAVNANFPELGAAIIVTSSYFDPGALEIAEQATSSGFLSRGSNLSYVNLSRKQGYHMCLVEARSGGFHMNVPEL